MLIPKSYRLLDDAIEEGCGGALNRVMDHLDDILKYECGIHKFPDLPPGKWPPGLPENIRTQIVDAMENEVSIAIYERFEIPYPDDSQTPENVLKSACIQARSIVGRIITRYLKKRGGMGDSRGGAW